MINANFANTAVIIPVYNSEKFIKKLIEELLSVIKNIIVVDDGSTDKSFEIYSKYPVKYFRYKKNRGKGEALKKGFEIAIREGFLYAITLDSDYQHLPQDVPKFIKRQIATGANLIYGKRNFSPFVMPPARIMSNFLTSLIVSLKIKNRIYDSQCGFRLYDLSFIKRMQIKTDKYQTETELLIKFAKLSAKFDFVPIKTIYDKEKSYISHVRDIKNFIKVILNT